MLQNINIHLNFNKKEIIVSLKLKPNIFNFYLELEVDFFAKKLIKI